MTPVNIQITEYPGGHMLLITPEEVHTNVSKTPSVGRVPSSSENTDHCLQNTFNKTILGLQKQLNEISSKVSVLESKLERRLIHDVKNSPNVFFVPPTSPEPSLMGGSALEHLRDKKPADRVEWIIPLTESTTPAPEPPPKNLFSRIISQEHAATSSIPQQQIDLLNRAKRRSEKRREALDKKPKVLSLCARIIPVDEKTQNMSSIPTIRRSKRNRRDAFSKDNSLKEHSMMSEWLRAVYKPQEERKMVRNAALKAWLGNKLERDGLKVDNVKLRYAGEAPSVALKMHEVHASTNDYDQEDQRK
ncbi:uncharacterized protein LOC107037210 isoform X2 [Diachasma alloeum]|nr:uncharacterized protein LOC107037210 isoform X2 [Diachasma alloeum]XP_015111107.1 uncharacterized protein LOC107037210 isoform X2 [Diachasma alloeum]XP_015111109.1 uncharacterized protein LOC107037210 isoform X2 [Diachasma alloeum]XP_015111110.1 uncharacterized protein LOC107037210 isoform X2 [Diachasma alloeum]XP_015111111.1 uncharacterized protein LOC107037210 isoform X2 [Diachasma alloeum]XP_015111112.1 uncharacterized protein LOC107037210 isoform X2 [Diachasma alloeum]XP_015111113.1 un